MKRNVLRNWMELRLCVFTWPIDSKDVGNLKAIVISWVHRRQGT